MRHTIPTPFLSCILRGTVLCTMPKISEQGIFMSVSTASFNEAGILAYNDGNYAEAFKCLELGDHIPIRSLPYFKARRLLSTLLIPVTSPPAP